MNLNLKLDYVSFRCTENLPKEQVLKLIEQPLLDEETGEVLGPTLYPNQWRVYEPANGTTVFSFLQGGEVMGYYLAEKYRLPVTRLDIALDTYHPEPKFIEPTLDLIYDRLKAHREDTKSQRPLGKFIQVPKGDNGKWGISYGSAGSDQNIRIYHKLAREPMTDGIEGQERIRYEWTVRRDDARAVFEQLVTEGPENAKHLYDLHQNLTELNIAPDFFGFGGYDTLDIVPAPKTENGYGVTNWFYRTVLPASIRYFKDTGTDILGELHQYFIEQLRAEDEGRERPVSSTKDKRLKRLDHLANDRDNGVNTGQLYKKHLRKGAAKLGAYYNPESDGTEGQELLTTEPPPF